MLKTIEIVEIGVRRYRTWKRKMVIHTRPRYRGQNPMRERKRTAIGQLPKAFCASSELF